MTKGGYQIIDFSGNNFTIGATGYVRDVYEKIEGTRKVILVSGLAVNDVEYRDAFVDFTVNAGNYVGSMYDVKITIGTDGSGLDSVTITNLEN